ncbi:mxr1 [Candida pseudojiufengensis]|uniref:mxr1 n=1 Tax=Candida pseudojiufengensis TaxID=497109 RepID=UPI0022253404|nr:mxr1 [Candida pseudojiufengensis]KAI5964635.1 mxr1 [Candida pseudojiufengensis]
MSTRSIVLGGGCFWGLDHIFRKQLTGKGLINIAVGYANGDPSVKNVTYEKVCSGKTNFVEVAKLEYDSKKLPTSEILDLFFKIHDPTTVNSQGPDVGTQYKSAIFTTDDEQLKLAKEIKEKFQKEWYPNQKIATIIEPLRIFVDAEEYHQNYLNKNKGGYECPTHFIRTKPKV